MKKPPAFQFYAKDWNSSPTISGMSLHNRGVFITMMAHSWDSNEPGTLPLPLKITAKICGISEKNVRQFLENYPKTFSIISGKLVCQKLAENWINYKEISEKREKAARERWDAIASQVICPAPAPAPAPAPEVLKSNTPRPKPALEYSPEFLQFWKVYPKKHGKVEAWKEWQKLKINGELPLVIESVEIHKKTSKWAQGYIPDPCRYIKRKLWEDEIQPEEIPDEVNFVQ